MTAQSKRRKTDAEPTAPDATATTAPATRPARTWEDVLADRRRARLDARRRLWALLMQAERHRLDPESPAPDPEAIIAAASAGGETAERVREYERCARLAVETGPAALALKTIREQVAANRPALIAARERAEELRREAKRLEREAEAGRNRLAVQHAEAHARLVEIRDRGSPPYLNGELVDATRDVRDAGVRLGQLRRAAEDAKARAESEIRRVAASIRLDRAAELPEEWEAAKTAREALTAASAIYPSAVDGRTPQPLLDALAAANEADTKLRAAELGLLYQRAADVESVARLVAIADVAAEDHLAGEREHSAALDRLAKVNLEIAEAAGIGDLAEELGNVGIDPDRYDAAADYIDEDDLFDDDAAE